MSDPLQSGLIAGQAAYSGTAPKRMGISAADLSSVRGDVTSGLQKAAAQRQTIADNAAKQTAGAYPTSGTSAAMYNYMRGQGGYPVNAVPSTQPVNTGSTGYGGIGGLPARQVLPTSTVIQKPYEQSVKTGTPTQTELANTAKTSPSKMGTVTQPTINMPKPSLMQQLLATAGPMYLGYTVLDKTGGLDALSKGWDKLFGADALPAGYDASSTQALIDQYYTNPSIDMASAGSEDALQILADREAARVAAEQAAAASAASDFGYVNGSDLASDIYAGGAGAGTATTGGISDAAAGWDAATAGEYGGPAAAGTLSDLEVAQAATNAEAAGMDWAAMTAEYGPYVAAAIIADQMLNEGRITEGITNAVGDVVEGAGNVIEGAGDLVSSGVKSVGNFFGGLFADGGQVKGYADGGISVGSVPFRQTVGTDGFSAPYDAQSLMYQNNPTVAMARGGLSAAASHLGGYSDGGRLLKGPGDGVSDSIPAVIGNKQPARLADGEFVIPARIVSELGNGSTEAGARKLYAMMDRVQKARGKTVGKGKVAKNTRADKYLPK